MEIARVKVCLIMNVSSIIRRPIQIAMVFFEIKLARRRIKFGFFAAFLCLLILQPAGPVSAEPSALSSDLSKWLGHARIAGAELDADMDPDEIEQILTRLVLQKVNVIRADSNLTGYSTDAEFQRTLKFIKTFTKTAHRKGLRVVWNYPVLEVLTANVATTTRSMFKDHPDWVQVGLSDNPNVFYGRNDQAGSIEQGTESAWMTLQSPYAEYYLKRLKKIAATGVDGLWLKAPLLNDFTADWADVNPYAKAKFKSDTGLIAPTSVNWSSEIWRRWVAWRYQEVAGFLERIAQTARSVSSNISVIVENVSLDNVSAAQLGQDATRLKSSGLIHVWAIDALSSADAMRGAHLDDWISLIAMNKFAKAASGDKPSWVITSGFKPDDAGLVMAEALATGNHPYETHISDINTSVGSDFRKRMFSWVKLHGDRLFKSRSASKIAVYFSPESRDYQDKSFASGLYATTKKGDPSWWSNAKEESVYKTTYLAEYRGIIKWLVHQHMPFDVLVKPSKEELARYDVVLAPALAAISDQAANRIKQYVVQGGNLVLTGPNPLGKNEFGTKRYINNVLNYKRSKKSGRIRRHAGLIGKRYLTTNAASSNAFLATSLREMTRPVLTTNADKAVHIEMRERPGETLLHFVNATGMKGNFSIPPIGFNVGLSVPEGKQIKQITLTSPDLPEGKIKILNWNQKEDVARFEVSMQSYALIIVSYENTVEIKGNDLPIAQDDNLLTPANTPIVLSADKILVNDGDLDGDKLELTNVTTLGKLLGKLEKVSNGNFVYTPQPGFIGQETIQYTMKDAKGAISSARIHIAVHHIISKYGPKTVQIKIGNHRYGTIDSLARTDTETYDVNAEQNADGSLVDWTLTAKFQERIAEIASVSFTYTGQYSLNGIDQTISLYNYSQEKWEAVDTRKMAAGDDVTFSIPLPTAIEHYISSNSEMRIRLRGRHGREEFSSWMNAAFWEVTQKP